jgi:hypothetical protein
MTNDGDETYDWVTRVALASGFRVLADASPGMTDVMPA